MDLVHLGEGETHRVATLGNVLICAYWGQPPVQALHARLPWVEQTIADGHSLGLFNVILEQAAGQLPGRAFRAESKRQADAFRAHVVLSASVIEGRGVTASLIRTFLRSLATVAARGIEVRFFDDVVTGAEWTAETMASHGAPAAEAISAGVAALRPVELPPPEG